MTLKYALSNQGFVQMCIFQQILLSKHEDYFAISAVLHVPAKSECVIYFSFDIRMLVNSDLDHL